jgi:hypothetical protein
MCSEPLWELVGEAVTALIRQASLTAQPYQIHAYSAMYNIYDSQTSLWHACQVIASIQEIKKDLSHSITDLKDAWPEPSSLTRPGCLNISFIH